MARLLTVLFQGYISTPTKQLIHKLSEVGHLYIRVDRFIREREARSGIGMIEQSLCHHLQSQLTEYYRLIAVLESQLNIASNSQDQNTQSSLAVVPPEPDIRAEESGLTLRRLDVWVNEWKLRMRMMSVCVEAAKGTYMSLPLAGSTDSLKIRTVVHLSTSFTATQRTATHLCATLQTSFLKRYVCLRLFL